MNMKSIVLSAWLALVPAAAIASMSGGGGGMGLEGGLFWGADLDRNERLDPHEAKAVHNLAEPEIFRRFDENANGSISRVEFSEFMQRAPWTDPFVHPAKAK